MTNPSSKQVEPELKACPFCGRAVTATTIKGASYLLVGCKNLNCAASAISCDPIEWNTRVPVASTAPRMDIQDLQQKIDELPAACDCGNLDPRDVDRLIEKAAASLASKEEEARRCPHCGRRMVSEFDEDVGFWRECGNCDYREALSSTTPPAPTVSDCDPD